MTGEKTQQAKKRQVPGILSVTLWEVTARMEMTNARWIAVQMPAFWSCLSQGDRDNRGGRQGSIMRENLSSRNSKNDGHQWTAVQMPTRVPDIMKGIIFWKVLIW
jgi:hypothetical protein